MEQLQIVKKRRTAHQSTIGSWCPVFVTTDGFEDLAQRILEENQHHSNGHRQKHRKIPKKPRKTVISNSELAVWVPESYIPRGLTPFKKKKQNVESKLSEITLKKAGITHTDAKPQRASGARLQLHSSKKHPTPDPFDIIDMTLDSSAVEAESSAMGARRGGGIIDLTLEGSPETVTLDEVADCENGPHYISDAEIAYIMYLEEFE